MTALASRLAGMRLLAIISVLLVPILLLSYLTITNIRADISFASKEYDGVMVADALTVAMLDLGAEKATGHQAAAQLEKIMAPGQRINMADELEGVREILSNPAATRRDQLKSLTDAMHENGVRSNLILDPYGESFFLALNNIMNMPDLVKAFHNFRTMLRESIDSAGIDSSEFKSLLLHVGNLSEAIRRSSDSVSHARELSGRPEAYLKAEALLDKMRKEVDVTIDVITVAKAGSEPLVFTMLAQQTFDPTANYVLAGDVWNDTSARLSDLLQARLQALWLRQYILLAVAALCVLIGVGSSLWMFRSTLTRLDLVEEEKRRADAALHEAEVMGQQIHKVNEDVTSLNRELAEKVMRLKEAQDELVQKGRMEQLGQLTATIAHEIRNPLGSVRTSAFLLEKKTAGKGLGLETQIDRINKGVTRCDNIITQLLDFSRTKQLAAQPAQLDDWLEKTIEEEAGRLPLSVSVECQLGLGSLSVPFDASRLQRAIANLLSNASEAMVGTGEDPQKATTENPWILVSTRATEEHAIIRVADNGPGMTPEILAKVREPLFTTKSFGTGLGIPAIEKIMEQHGGHMVIESTPGLGSVFTLHLPLSSAQTAEKAA